MEENPMKRIIALFFIVVIATASLFAFEFRALGIETGEGLLVSANMEPVDKLDAYVRIGYTGGFNFSFGGQYQIAEAKSGSVAIPVKPGLQLNFNFFDGYFLFQLFGTCEFSFETGHFGAFIRPGIGLSAAKGYSAFAWTVETGVRYMF